MLGSELLLKAAAHVLGSLARRRIVEEMEPPDRRARIRERVPYLVPHFATRAAGRRVELHEDTLTITATWWCRLLYRKVRYGKHKGQRIPGSVTVPLRAMTRADWYGSPYRLWRSRLVVDAPGLGDRWCWRGLWGRERPHKLKQYRSKHQGIGWVAMGVWWVRQDLQVGPRLGFPVLHGSPAVAPSGGRARSMRQDMAGRRRRTSADDITPRRDGVPVGRRKGAAGRVVSMTAEEHGRRRRT